MSKAHCFPYVIRAVLLEEGEYRCFALRHLGVQPFLLSMEPRHTTPINTLDRVWVALIESVVCVASWVLLTFDPLIEPKPPPERVAASSVLLDGPLALLDGAMRRSPKPVYSIQCLRNIQSRFKMLQTAPGYPECGCVQTTNKALVTYRASKRERILSEQGADTSHFLYLSLSFLDL